MKKERKIVLTLSFFILILGVLNINAQEEEEEKVKIKAISITEKDGKEHIWDTLFLIGKNADFDVQEFILKKFPDKDSTIFLKTRKNNLVVVKNEGIKLSDEKHAHFFIQSGDDSDCEDKKVIKIRVSDIDSLGNVYKKIQKKLVLVDEEMEHFHGDIDKIEYEIQALIDEADESEKKLHIKELRDGKHAKVFTWHSDDSDGEDKKVIKIRVSDVDSLRDIHKKIQKKLVLVGEEDELKNQLFIKKLRGGKHAKAITLHLDDNVAEIEYEIQSAIDRENEFEKQIQIRKLIKEKLKGQKKMDFFVLRDSDKDIDVDVNFENKEFIRHLHKEIIISDELTEKDIKNLNTYGIKLKDESLNIKRVNLHGKHDDYFELNFTLKTKGVATIKIISETGNEIYKDKVQYFPGTYIKTTNLRTDASGVFYVIVEQKGKTYACKINLPFS